MRTAEFVGFGKSVILRRRMKIEANLTTYLTFLSAIVPGQIRFGSIADRAGAVIGGKTGTTNAAGHCLILLSRDTSGAPYISVILNSSASDVLYPEMVQLLEQINK